MLLILNYELQGVVMVIGLRMHSVMMGMIMRVMGVLVYAKLKRTLLELLIARLVLMGVISVGMGIQPTLNIASAKYPLNHHFQKI